MSSATRAELTSVKTELTSVKVQVATFENATAPKPTERLVVPRRDEYAYLSGGLSVSSVELERGLSRPRRQRAALGHAQATTM